MLHPFSIDQIYVFGDSLSDIGTSFLTPSQNPPRSPYYQGRYSNGPVWVEHLARKLALSQSQVIDAAAGGATSGKGSNGIPGVLDQINQFIKTYPQPGAGGLYVVWSGANDYLNGADSPAVPIRNVTQAIALLIDHGAQMILVGNLPDLGNLPAVRANPYAHILKLLINAHNVSLTQSLTGLKQRFGAKVQIIEFDTYTLYQEALSNPLRFGFTNITDSCLSNQVICSNPDQFLFWDGIHPTAAAHRILGEHAYSLIQTAVSSVALRARPKLL